MQLLDAGMRTYEGGMMEPTGRSSTFVQQTAAGDGYQLDNDEAARLEVRAVAELLRIRAVQAQSSHRPTNGEGKLDMWVARLQGVGLDRGDSFKPLQPVKLRRKLLIRYSMSSSKINSR